MYTELYCPYCDNYEVDIADVNSDGLHIKCGYPVEELPDNPPGYDPYGPDTLEESYL